jgi:FixJ family two-component response regulator
MLSEANREHNPSSEIRPTVFIVDDDRGLCAALSYLLQSVNLQCETYSSPDRFLAAYDPSRPGCLVVDVRMPGMSGLDFQNELASRDCRLPIIMITGYADVATAVRAMKGGAMEFLEKPFADQVILDSIQQAIDRDRSERKRREEGDRFHARLALLTPREREVMDLLVEGSSNKDIAITLKLSRKTVETHRANLMKKTRAKSLAALIRCLLGSKPQA